MVGLVRASLLTGFKTSGGSEKAKVVRKESEVKTGSLSVDELGPTLVVCFAIPCVHWAENERPKNGKWATDSEAHPW